MLIVISDLHLSEGRRQESRKLAPTEDFFFDEEFARFLDHLQTRAVGEQVHLVINGDLFDFLQVGVSREEIACSHHLSRLTPKEQSYICRYGAKTDEASSVFKLDKIHQGHIVFFDALAAFLGKGHKVTIVSGNHDAELFWPDVGDRLKAILSVSQLAQESDPLSVKCDLNFAPWIYVDRDYGVYIEHGNQYESINSWRYWLYPVLPGQEDQLYLPFGSLFVRYFLNEVEAISPFADNIKPNTKYVAWVVRNNPLALGHLFKLFRRFCVTVAKIYKRSRSPKTYSREEIRLFEDKTDERLAAVAAEYGFAGDPKEGSHPLRRLASLQKEPFNEGRARFIWHFVFSNLDLLLFALSALFLVVFVGSAFIFGWRNIISIGSLLLALGGAVAGNFFYRLSADLGKTYKETAAAIGRILSETEPDIPYVIFGHTHQPAIEALGRGRAYYNTGTWGVIFNEEEELIREKQQFAFVLVPAPGAEPQLLRWNDHVGRPEMLPLFDSGEVGIMTQ